MPLQLKKTVNKTLTCDRTLSDFFGLDSSGRFHWDYWALVSMSLIELLDDFIQMIGHDSTSVMTFLSKSGPSLNVVNISWVMSMWRCFCSIFSNFGTIFPAIRFMLKTFVKIAWMKRTICKHHQQPLQDWFDDYPKSFSSLLHRLSTFSGRPELASSLTSSRPSLNRFYHNWTCVLLMVDSPNATVNISNAFVL